MIALTLAVPPGAAQELPLKPSLPEPSPGGCYGAPAFDPAPPDPSDAQEADRLAAAATQTAVLGDQDGARDFLERAADLDPTDEGIAYDLARTYQALGRPTDAVQAYCRYLALAPGGPDAEDVRSTVQQLNPADVPLPSATVSAFDQGVAAFQRGDMGAAGEAFSSAISRSPDLAVAYYDRALVRSANREYDGAIDDFRRYLDLTPDAQDQAVVLERIGTLRSPPAMYSPGTALAVGMFVPGFGQFHTDRPVAGLFVLSAAAAAAGFGALYSETQVNCRTLENPCPPSQVIESTTERPYLVAGLVTAAGIALAGAIEGFVKAKKLNAEAASVVGAGNPDRSPRLELLPGAAHATWDGGVALELARITF